MKHSLNSWSIFRTLECVALIILITFSSFGETLAQDNQPTDDEINAIAKQLYCPVCENVPLDVCGTRACAQWRDNIREKLADGWNAEQIKQYFSDQYGVRVLAQPPTQGVNLLFWALPPFAIVVSWFFVLRLIDNLTRKHPSGSQSVIKLGDTDDYKKLLERDLEQWR